MLPLGPPDEDGSPYASPSAFAGWPGLLARPRARVSRAEVDDFRERHAAWIGDWERFAGEGAVEDQVRFAREWGELREHATARGVLLMGDVPFYVAPRGADARAHPELFRDDLVAGVPPDAFSDDGQLWGNPTYDWAAVRATGYRWWVDRFRRTLELVDAARIDHFRAFTAWWGVPTGARSATAGRWRRGPGPAVVEAARAELGDVPLVAEDLGEITPAVRRLMTGLDLPGMRVLHFAFSGRADNPYLPANHPEHAVVYTGTHDNDTTAGWWASLDERERAQAARVLEEAGIRDDAPARALVRLALASAARTALVPAQDLLGLGSEARMNTPGRRSGNWGWRLRRGQLTAELAAWLRERTAEAGRLPQD
ncbi:MAG: 4-alpha-glucanotransferase [Miltoncostaeaceae bacterium]|nr:4-alpha-glucanotransferase [Miltoncostaeaceae bacterium]